MSDFNTKLDILTSAELTACKGDTERLAAMVEKLGSALGFTVAMASRGDPKGIDTFCEGLTHYIHGEAVSKAPLARMLAATLYSTRGGR